MKELELPIKPEIIKSNISLIADNFETTEEELKEFCNSVIGKYQELKSKRKKEGDEGFDEISIISVLISHLSIREQLALLRIQKQIIRLNIKVGMMNNVKNFTKTLQEKE